MAINCAPLHISTIDSITPGGEYEQCREIGRLASMSAAKRGVRNGILSLAIKDKAVLYAAYMPFVQNGGLFIPTKKDYELGDEVFMLLNLMDEAEKIPVAGKVVWITPKGAQGNRAAGIGVQFNDQDDMARSKIETYLAGALQSDRHTHTM
jgi:type IV pilus assembly protein PilZ